MLAEGPQAIVDGMLPKLFAPESLEKLTDIVKAFGEAGITDVKLVEPEYK